MRNARTRSGARRAGDDYQDIVAINMALDMLQHPFKYAWMQVEADDVGALDDIVALAADGTLLVRQVKYSNHSDDQDDFYSWDQLLEYKGKGTSLLKKWVTGVGSAIASLPPLGASQLDAKLVTNRRLSTELQDCLDNGKVVLARIPPDVLARVYSQIDPGPFQLFVDNFVWESGAPELEELEETLWYRFAGLGGTEAGWDSIQNKMRGWVRNRNEPPPSGKIKVAHIRSAAKWCPLERLPQEFEVPSYFVPPSGHFHEELVRLLESGANTVVLEGSPGVGKSTYLSYLTAELKSRGELVLRHHYWLSEREDHRERLEADRIAQSLLADIHDEYANFVPVAVSRNPHAKELLTSLEALAERATAANKRLIIILDGIDHVWREEGYSLKQLDLLLARIPQHSALSLVIGTQTIPRVHFSNSATRRLRDAVRLGLPALGTEAIASILSFHLDALGFSADQPPEPWYLRDLAEAFAQRGGDHPLYLRYMIEELRERAVRVTRNVVYDLPECPDRDVRKYYANLLHLVQPGPSLAVQIIVEAPFPLREEELCQILRAMDCTSVEAQDAFAKIRNLLVGAGVGYSLFHGSVRQFVMESPGSSHYIARVRSAILDWLRSVSDDDRHWGYEWLLQYHWEGNPSPLQDGPTREWSIAAIASGKDLSHACHILRESALSCLRYRRYNRFMISALLEAYLCNVADYFHDQRRLLSYTILRLPENAGLFDVQLSHIEALDTEEILELLRYDFEASHGARNEEIFEGLRRRFNWVQNARVSRDTAGWGEGLESLVRAGAYVTMNWDRVNEIADNRKAEVAVLATAAREMLRARNISGLRELWQRTNERNRFAVSRYVGILALESGLNVDEEFAQEDARSLAFSQIYFSMRYKKPVASQPLVPPPPRFTKSITSFESDAVELMEWLLDYFWASVSSAMASGQNICQIPEGPDDIPPWTASFLSCLRTAAEFVSCSLTSKDFKYTAWLELFAAITIPRWKPGSADQPIVDVAKRVFSRLALEVLRVMKSDPSGVAIEQTSLGQFAKISLFDADVFHAEYTTESRRLLPDQMTASLLRETLGEETQRFDYSENKAHTAALVSQVAILHGMNTLATTATHRAAEAMLSHGFRKDSLLDEALDVLKCVAPFDGEKVQRLLGQLAPAIVHIGDYTDGRGTDHLPRTLARLLALHAPRHLPKYYLLQMESEEFNDAENTLTEILQLVEIEDDTIAAIASTAIDRASLEVIRKKLPGISISGGREAVEGSLAGFLLFSDEVEEAASIEPSGSSETSLEEPTLPSVEDFELSQLDDFIDALRPHRSRDSIGLLSKWLEYWRKAVPAARLIELLIDARKRRGSDVPARPIFEVVRTQFGVEDAYPWLKQAAIDAGCWNEFSCMHDTAIWFWEWVKKDYSEQWDSFLAETFEASLYKPERRLHIHHSASRIVEFLVYMEGVENATGAAHAFAEAALDYVAVQPLSTSGWRG